MYHLALTRKLRPLESLGRASWLAFHFHTASTLQAVNSMSTIAQSLEQTVDQHDPHPGDGRRRSRQQRPSRHADGPGPGGLPAVDAASALRSRPTPLWPNRDRFVLSCGHASMLLYSLLHLAGIREVDGRRQRDRRAVAVARRDPATSANWAAARRAIPSTATPAASKPRPARSARAAATASAWRSPSRWLAARYNKPGFELFDFNVWTQCSDGDLMEGIANEAASLAGHLKLSNLCWIYDDNHITIEGNTDLAFSEDVATRFRGLGWHVLAVHDANDLAALDKAYQRLPVARRTARR